MESKSDLRLLSHAILCVPPPRLSSELVKKKHNFWSSFFLSDVTYINVEIWENLEEGTREKNSLQKKSVLVSVSNLLSCICKVRVYSLPVF